VQDRQLARLHLDGLFSTIQQGLSVDWNAGQWERVSSGQSVIFQQGIIERRLRIPAMLIFL
jgi:hypothetical protein